MSTYRVRYQTVEFGGDDIHLRTLRDNQQFSDDQHVAEDLGIFSAAWPMFGVLWQSSQVLAHVMQAHNIDNLRILEVGCGIGLTSLMLQQRGADITATDHHPEANKFLRANAALNQLAYVPFERVGWADLHDSLGMFDLIVGSDLLYERDHVDLLSQFIERHLAANGEMILVDPKRGHQHRFTRAMESLGLVTTVVDNPKPQLTPEFTGCIHCYTRMAVQ